MSILIIVLAIVIYNAQRWSLDHALNGVTYDYQCSKLLIEPGEEFEVITTITNSSRRFIPFVKVEEFFPVELIIHDAQIATRDDLKGNKRYISTIYMMPRSKLVRKITASFDARGRYIFHGGDLKGGDFLGISENIVHHHLFREIVVYPERVATPEITSTMGGFMGDISIRRFIIEDPILTIGSREYTGREPMKAISWSHSARVGHLMVKQFDHTIDPAVSVIFDIRSFEPDENMAPRKEFCFKAVRTVCETLENQNMKYDFITNAMTMDAFSRWSYLNESIGPRHIAIILEGLGRATHSSVEDLREVMETLMHKHEQNRSAILITAKSPTEYGEDVHFLESKFGGKVFIISAGDYIS